MSDLTDRMAFEARFARELSKLTSKQRQEFRDKLGTPPDYSRITPDDWSRWETERRNRLLLFLLLAGLDSAETHAAEVEAEHPEAGDLKTEARKHARDWAINRSAVLASEQVRKARERLDELANQWRQMREVPPELVDQDLVDTFAPRFDATTAATETTAGNSAGINGALNAARDAGVPMVLRWFTRADDRVCFPAGTMVSAECGSVPIESLSVGDRVFTRNGLRAVAATSRRTYSGKMARVATTQAVIDCTADHPFWTRNRGWVKASELDVSDTLQSVENQPVDIVGRFDFLVGDASQFHSCGGDGDLLSVVPISVAVPIDAVCLKGDNQTAIGCDCKVDGPPAELHLEYELDSQSFEGFANDLFESTFTAKARVASPGAEGSVCVAGLDSDLLSARLAVLNERRASTCLGAMKSVVPLFAGGDSLSTAAAIPDDYSRLSAINAARSVSVCLGCTDGKLSIADSARFEDSQNCGFPAYLRAENLSPADAGWNEIEGSATHRARPVLSGPSSGRGREFDLCTSPGLVTHGCLSDFSSTVEVYDIQVEEDHEFFANGVLVHNCLICGPLHRKIVDLWELVVSNSPSSGRAAALASIRENGGPPAHPNCRCHAELVPLRTPIGALTP